MSEEKKEKEKSAEPTEELKETGSANLEGSRDNHRIKLLTIVGEIEGHEAVSGNTKATKYEHLLPMLAEVEDSSKIDGLLILLNTLGGDVEAGLSIAEMIASLSKPTVSLVLGGSHSIGGPLAVSADYSFIVPSGTMVIHPVRSNGMFIGVQQSLDHKIFVRTFFYEAGADRRVNVKPYRAGQRCWNTSGRKGCCKRRTH